MTVRSACAGVLRVCDGRDGEVGRCWLGELSSLVVCLSEPLKDIHTQSADARREARRLGRTRGGTEGEYLLEIIPPRFLLFTRSRCLSLFVCLSLYPGANRIPLQYDLILFLTPHIPSSHCSFQTLSSFLSFPPSLFLSLFLSLSLAPCLVEFQASLVLV